MTTSMQMRSPVFAFHQGGSKGFAKSKPNTQTVMSTTIALRILVLAGSPIRIIGPTQDGKINVPSPPDGQCATLRAGKLPLQLDRATDRQLRPARAQVLVTRKDRSDLRRGDRR